MASDEMLTWLRATIESDKGLAEVTGNCERYGVRYTGHWTYTVGDDLVYQDDRRGPGVAGIVGRSCDCCGPASAGHPHDLMHIATHDPRDTIARCEAELALIARYEGPDEPGTTPDFWCAMRESIEMLAQGYRHRPGFDPEWLEG